MSKQCALSQTNWLKLVPIISCALIFSCQEDPLSPCADNGNCEGVLCSQVEIPAGEFSMGSSAEPSGDPGEFFGIGDARPSHRVVLGPYCIDRFEVTSERYQACVAAGACTRNGREWMVDPPEMTDEVVVDHYPPECVDTPSLCPTLAINSKSWEQARDYCHWIGRRLCTEAEWERAANGPGTEQHLFPWGDDELTMALANVNFDLPFPSDTCPADRYVTDVEGYEGGASSEMVFGMMGNVSEWVLDWYGPYEYVSGGTVRDPEGPETGEFRVVRGGCAFRNPFGLTNTSRWTLDPGYDHGSVGIRCCADAR